VVNPYRERSGAATSSGGIWKTSVGGGAVR
jgi:hypothetical protein